MANRYGSFGVYNKRWEAARDEMVRGRCLHKEDADRLGAKPLAAWAAFPGPGAN